MVKTPKSSHVYLTTGTFCLNNYASMARLDDSIASFLFFFSFSFFLFFFFFVFSLGPHPRHMEVPRLGVESEL